MLAVGAVPEKQRGRLQPGQSATVRLIDGTIADGEVAFVSQTAASATRTYRVEVQVDNPDAAIADGVTCEITVSLDPVVAASVPRSALVFSDSGELGVRAVDADGRVAFHPIDIVQDNRQEVWVSGLEGPTRVITLGQDFVKEGDSVDAVSSSELALRDEEPAT
jgi:multidrug efflux system membrane fusion protein